MSTFEPNNQQNCIQESYKSDYYCNRIRNKVFACNKKHSKRDDAYNIIKIPAIQFVVDECISSGITDIIIVTRFGNHSIEDYFDSSPELERYLKQKAKTEEAKRIRRIYTCANFVFIRQNKSLPYGNESPLLAAKTLIDNDEPFLYLYGDNIIFGRPTACQQIVERYQEDLPDAVLGATEVDLKTVTPGVLLKIKEGIDDQIEPIIEKPKPEEALSNIYSFGRYLFTHSIFDYLNPKI